MLDDDDDSVPTRLYMEGGAYVRVSESLGDVSMLLPDAERDDGWAPFTDPGDDRAKLVRASRVLWAEEESFYA